MKTVITDCVSTYTHEGQRYGGDMELNIVAGQCHVVLTRGSHSFAVSRTQLLVVLERMNKAAKAVEGSQS